MQRHKAEGKPLSGIISSLRSAWDRNPELFRIILAVKPYDVIATGRSLEEVRDRWNTNLEQPPTSISRAAEHTRWSG